MVVCQGVVCGVVWRGIGEVRPAQERENLRRLWCGGGGGGSSGVVWYGVMRCVVLCGAVWCCVVLCGVEWSGGCGVGMCGVVMCVCVAWLVMYM